MGHHHDHHHHSSNNIKVAFFLNFAFTILEIIGGLYVNSIAIISDAIHDLGDTISLGTSWYLEEISHKKSNKKFSFGYKRFSLLGALINSIILIIGSLYVITEAVGRILEPEHTDAKGMIFFAVIGVLVNGYAAWKLSGGKTMNEKVASWHLVEDVLGWVAVLVVAIILNFKDIHYLDPALSLLITIYILWNVIIRLKQTLFIFLQGVPEELDINEIESKILNIDFVNSIHHMHIWSLEGEHNVFTAHIKIDDNSNLNNFKKVKFDVKDILKEYKFEHYTVEVEFNDENCDLDDN
ncbi:MAG: cation transporter [Flavobacteriaceae bacterium]|jgi:cobalt-zinc-cadmium efflux system protein|nr:cation transporter [Flavobacteriaceae bacterium]MBT4112955.1 cation transporter [Flavobacteriaceae bacterium]MBT4245886.1 cation transporter [Flavobacteriaceae bacterium]MBT4614577.1 cation transporter [Flavobacteriaceae bacterium]MBT5246185.1 cation transporter [Flavobacteriaceae bacterium]